jgi:hypothetical protein
MGSTDTEAPIKNLAPSGGACRISCSPASIGACSSIADASNADAHCC